MRVLVLGADGFVGRHVVAALAASGWATAIAGGRRARADDARHRIVVDAIDRAALAVAVDGVDAVVNCVAGSGRVITANAAALASVAAQRRVVQLSSMAVYGSTTGIIDERAALRDDNGAYGAAKIEAEAVLARHADVAILRPGCIYGRGSPQWSRRIAALLRARRIGDLGAAGDGCSNLVHVDDVVAVALAALRSPAAGGGAAFNLAMPDAPDWNGYFLAVARAIGAVPIRRIPAWQLALETKLAAPPLALGGRVLRGLPPAIPPSLARLWRQNIRLDSRLASSTLGIAWTPLDAGIATTLDADSRPGRRPRAIA